MEYLDSHFLNKVKPFKFSRHFLKSVITENERGGLISGLPEGMEIGCASIYELAKNIGGAIRVYSN